MTTENTPVTEADSIETFGNEFDAIMNAPEGGVIESTAEAVKDEPEASADEPGATADEPGATADEPGATADEPGATTDEPEASAEEPDALKAMQAQLEALQAKIDASAEKEAQPAVEEPPAPPKPVYSDDEVAAIKKYEEDWEEVVAGERLIRKGEYTELVNHIFNEVQKAIAPLQQHFEARSGRDQYTDLVALVPDYDEVRDKAIAWVDTQPAIVRKAYKQVTETGTAEEVAELINIFKTSTGYTAAAPAHATPAASTAPDAGMPAKSAKKTAAAASLKMVKSARSAVSTAVDPNDFDAAFNEAVSK